MKVYRLYREAFPSSERKPFSVILKMSRNKKTDVWCMMKGTSFKGFATTINSREAVLLDYAGELPAADGIHVSVSGNETLITAAGTAAHASTPEDGDNALKKLLQTLAGLFLRPRRSQGGSGKAGASHGG